MSFYLPMNDDGKYIRYYPVIARNDYVEESTIINVKIKNGEQEICLKSINVTEQIHPNWLLFFEKNNIVKTINLSVKNIYKRGYENGFDVYPLAADAFAAFKIDPDEVKCVVIGQDPYPGWDRDSKEPVACGKCFATRSKKIPVSLNTIIESICEEIGEVNFCDKEHPFSLKGWEDQKVMLLNRINFLYSNHDPSCKIDQMSEAYLNSWLKITKAVCGFLNERGCFFVLVGKKAEELSTITKNCTKTVHPSKRSDKYENFDIKAFLNVPGIKWNHM